MAAARREEIVRLAVRTRRANPQSEQRNARGRRSALTKPVRWQRGQLIASKGIGGGHSAVAGDSQVGRLSEVQKLDGSVTLLMRLIVRVGPGEFTMCESMQIPTKPAGVCDLKPAAVPTGRPCN